MIRSNLSPATCFPPVLAHLGDGLKRIPGDLPVRSAWTWAGPVSPSREVVEDGGSDALLVPGLGLRGMAASARSLGAVDHCMRSFLRRPPYWEEAPLWSGRRVKGELLENLPDISDILVEAPAQQSKLFLLPAHKMMRDMFQATKFCSNMFFSNRQGEQWVKWNTDSYLI